MKNTSHILIGFSCLIVASAIAYYVLSYLPAKAQLAHQKECQTMAMNRFEKDKFDTADNYFINQPEFVFDDKSNQCLYKTNMTGSIQTLDDVLAYNSYEIWDLYTNKKLAGFSTKTRLDGKMAIEGDREGFDAIVIKYFLH